MLKTLAIQNYRSLLRVALPLSQLNLVTGANGSGKSNLYSALRLLAETAQGGVVAALAREGGLASTLWAGPEKISQSMRRGEVSVQGSMRQSPVRMKLGFLTQRFGYALSLGLPSPSESAFSRDPEIKRECIWAGGPFRPASILIDRHGTSVKIRSTRDVSVRQQSMRLHESFFSELSDPEQTPEVFYLREMIRDWRFYDHFRSDREAPARQAQIGTRTTVMHHDGRDLTAAIQTILEVGDADALQKSIDESFPGARLSVSVEDSGRFSLEFWQKGLLRPLSAYELSDGTLRFLLWVAALLTPRPPSMMVLNEPETSLHPDLLPALAGLIVRASQNTQVWVISHSQTLIERIRDSGESTSIHLLKDMSETLIENQSSLDRPVWHWPTE